ncbi:hypothetical protein [Nonomuraea sp. B19D2]|uniref:hypothetical protein n=1 Tax=Nonomuraea sp. B19D2 TaxID=3159561 RepID=UPI0032DB4BCC
MTCAKRAGWSARQGDHLALGGGLLVRAELGLAWAFGLGTDTGTPFYWLNLLLYSPLCVALRLATDAVLMRASSSGSKHEVGAARREAVPPG